MILSRKGKDGGKPLKREKKIRIALAQVNPTVGDLPGNIKKARSAILDARRTGAEIVAFPELMICGYPPEDLLLKESFLSDCENFLRELASSVKGITVLIGAPEKNPSGGKPFNSCFVLHDGKILGSYRKINLPNYGVFDEKRYFEPGILPAIIATDNYRIGLTICEDAWVEDSPIHQCARLCGAQIVFNISASHYHRKKGREREKLMRRRARESGAYLLYVNLIGGQDELVFDGSSIVAGPDGKLIARGRQFEEDIIVVDIPIKEESAETFESSLRQGTCDIIRLPKIRRLTNRPKPRLKKHLPQIPGKTQEVYKALVLGTRDYVVKNGFNGVVIGLSGGVDSALTAVIAVDALGNEMVHAITMPSVFTSSATLRDARKLAKNLGIELFEIPINPIYKAYIEALSEIFAGRENDVTEENIQARIRGNLLMALSNKFGWLVLATGNKSEFAVGYCTLYGDMAGGFAVLKDVPKTLVYPLCRYRNRVAGKMIIPGSILKRRPSAELKPDQYDEDTLPPYPILDRIIELYVEKDMPVDNIVKTGLDPDMVKRAIRMIDHNEYKRRQAPPGVKITPKAFGKDRRLPITNRYNPLMSIKHDR